METQLTFILPLLFGLGASVVILLIAYLLTKWINNSVIETMIRLESIEEKPLSLSITRLEGKIVAEQPVRLFEDLEKLGIQRASISYDDPAWISVSHDRIEITLSIENWKKLVTLTHSILPTEKGGY